MELTRYVHILRKWAWLLALVALIGGGVGYLSAARQPPNYVARATISIGRYIDSPNPNSVQIRTGIDLAQTYAQILKTRELMQATIDSLNLGIGVGALQRSFTTEILAGTSLIVVTVQYSDPALAAAIANALVETLIARSPTNLTVEQQEQIDFATAQIDALNAQLTSQRGALADLNARLEAATDPAVIDNLGAQRTALINQINQAAATIAQFQNTITSIQQRTNAVDIVDRAVPPTNPTNTNPLTTALLGAAMGLVLAVGAAMLIEQLDDRVRSAEIAAQLLGLPVLGAIPRLGRGSVSYQQALIDQHGSMSQSVEAYRRLRTNLMFAPTTAGKRIFIITSAGPGEGKSVTTANLALTMAQAGLNVLLIDADLRRPRQHDIFSLQNDVGLTTLLATNEPSAQELVNTKGYEPFMQATQNPRLRVITSGFTPVNPTEVLGSVWVRRWIDQFRSAPNVDVILIDTPPALMFADSSVLASITGADVLLLVHSRRTRRGAVRQVRDQFTRLGITIKGVVMNHYNPSDDAAGYTYEYGYYYYSYDDDKKKRRLFGLLK